MEEEGVGGEEDEPDKEEEVEEDEEGSAGGEQHHERMRSTMRGLSRRPRWETLGSSKEEMEGRTKPSDRRSDLKAESSAHLDWA